jgi:hypothetical protein
VLGVDMLVFGSDRPYAQPHPDLGLGDAARHAICVTNPARLLQGDRLPPGAGIRPSRGKERRDRDDHSHAAGQVSRPARTG